MVGVPPHAALLVAGSDIYTASLTSHDGGLADLGQFAIEAISLSNGQLSVGWHFNPGPEPVPQPVTRVYDLTIADTHPDGVMTATTESIVLTIAGCGADTFVFHPGTGAQVIANIQGNDTVELDGFAGLTGGAFAALLAQAPAGQAQSMLQAVNDGHDTLISLGGHDSVTLLSVHLADVHAINFIIA